MKKYIITVVMAALVSASAFGGMRSSDHAKRQAQINAQIEENNNKRHADAMAEISLELRTILANDAQMKTMNRQLETMNKYHEDLKNCENQRTQCTNELSDNNEKLLASEKNVTKFETESKNCQSLLNAANLDLRNKTEEIEILNNDVINAQISAMKASDLLANSKKVAINELLLNAITVMIDNDLINSKKTYENQTCTSDKNQRIQDIFNEVLVLLTAEKNITSNNTTI